MMSRSVTTGLVLAALTSLGTLSIVSAATAQSPDRYQCYNSQDGTYSTFRSCSETVARRKKRTPQVRKEDWRQVIFDNALNTGGDGAEGGGAGGAGGNR